MAKETISEKLVRSKCNEYQTSGIAKIKKNDPYIRLIDGKLIYSGSSGLDFSGIVKGGRYISFEVKETDNMSLPFDNISTTQVDTIEKEQRYGADSFLLVMFKKINQWYRLDYENLVKVMTDNDCKYASIPIQFFQAFGFLVPNDDGMPDFLHPERHPKHSMLTKLYPAFMIGHERREHQKQQLELTPIITDEDRKKRIMTAVVQGIKNAEKKEHQVKIYKRGSAYEPQRFDPPED